MPDAAISSSTRRHGGWAGAPATSTPQVTGAVASLRDGSCMPRPAFCKLGAVAPRGRGEVVVDASECELAALAALVDGNAGLRLDRRVPPRRGVPLKSAGDAIVGDGAVLQRDAGAICKLQRIDLAQGLLARIDVRAPRRFAYDRVVLVGGEDALQVTGSQRCLVVADDVRGGEVGIGSEEGAAHRMAADERPQAVVD